MNAMRAMNEPRVPLALELTTTVGLALMAGFTFNMSTVTAPALNALSPEQALAAWKRINFTVRNPLFPATAFGTALLVVACAAVAWRSRLGLVLELRAAVCKRRHRHDCRGPRARFPSCSWRRCRSSWCARMSAGGARWPERRGYRYRYSSDAGEFAAEIVVDEEYLVLNYEGL
jgi:hypothetical protein